MSAPIPDFKIYRYHVENIRSVEIALHNTALSARKAISEENRPATESFVRLYALLLGAWAEDRLKKLLFEREGFTKEERESVLSRDTQFEQWEKAIEVAFRKYYIIHRADLNETTLPFSAHAKYTTLSEFLGKDIRMIIEVRNKLSHGQWIYPFNSDNSGIEQEKYKLFKLENLLSLQYKSKLISILADIIHDLVVSLSTFERDFDKHYRHIINTLLNLKNRKYKDYERILIEKRRRGIQKRKKA